MATKETNRVKIYSLANEMRGIITAEMALDAGVPLVEMRKLVQRGAINRVARNLYRVPFAPVDRYSDALEKVLAVGKNAYVSGPSVIALLDLGLFNPAGLHVTTTVKPRHSIPSSVQLKVIPASEAPEIVRYYDVPCEPVFNAIDSLIGRAMRERLYDAIDQALEEGFLTDLEAKALRRSVKNHNAKTID
jgi:predicted transcriptional regulator of viral defense system